MNTQTEANPAGRDKSASGNKSAGRKSADKKTAERAHPDSVQENYAREYAGDMTEKLGEKEYIESHREDLNGIFSTTRRKWKNGSNGSDLTIGGSGIAVSPRI